MCHDVLSDPELLEQMVEAMFKDLTTTPCTGMVVTVLLDETQTSPRPISPSPPAGRGHPPAQRQT